MSDEKKFMEYLVNDLKDFIMDAVDKGKHADYGDHFEFLSDCVEAFIEFKLDEEI